MRPLTKRSELDSARSAEHFSEIVTVNRIGKELFDCEPRALESKCEGNACFEFLLYMAYRRKRSELSLS